MVEILQLATKEHYFNKGTLLTSYKLRSLKQYSNKVFLVTLNSIKCQLMHYSVVNCFESFLEKKTNKTSKISNFDFFKNISKSSLQNEQSMRILKIDFALLLKWSQMNPKKSLYNTAFSVQLPCLDRHSL